MSIAILGTMRRCGALIPELPDAAQFDPADGQRFFHAVDLDFGASAVALSPQWRSMQEMSSARSCRFQR
jgi:hypothetical protein